MKMIKTGVLDSEFRAAIKSEIKNYDFCDCLGCGMCSAGCVFSDLIPDHDPRKFLRKLFLGMKQESLNDQFVFLCNMCERCTLDCPMLVNIADLVRTIRGNFYDREQYPGFIQKVVQEQLSTGNQMSVSNEEFFDTLQWLEEELRAELQVPDYKIPLDKTDADYFFSFNAREVKYYPQDLMAILTLFHVAGFNYTISSRKWDVTNLAIFTGKEIDLYNIQRPLFEEMDRLRARELIVTECGHAFRAARHAYRKFWQGRSFSIRHILQLWEEAINKGLFKLDRRAIKEPVTYHDPCNIARKEGVYEEGRNVLKSFVTDFRDMIPNRKYNYCCGGGGGLVAIPEYRDFRVRLKGQRKAEQIRATGAKIVAIPCHNCMDQIEDITRHFNLGTNNRHVSSLLREALILPR